MDGVNMKSNPFVGMLLQKAHPVLYPVKKIAFIMIHDLIAKGYLILYGKPIQKIQTFFYIIYKFLF